MTRPGWCLVSGLQRPVRGGSQECQRRTQTQTPGQWTHRASSQPDPREWHWHHEPHRQRVRPDQGNEELNEGGFYGTPFKSDNTVSLKIMWWCLRTWESLAGDPASWCVSACWCCSGQFLASSRVCLWGVSWPNTASLPLKVQFIEWWISNVSNVELSFVLRGKIDISQVNEKSEE